MNGLFRPEWSTLKKLMFLQSASGGTYATISGNPVSFTAKAAPLRQLQVAFSPVQSGSGDPSPDNVRPISGWTFATVNQAGTNLVNQDVLLIGTDWVKSPEALPTFENQPVYSGTLANLCSNSKPLGKEIPVLFDYEENTQYRVTVWWRRYTPNTNAGIRAKFFYSDGTTETSSSQVNNTENFIRHAGISASGKTVTKIALNYNSSSTVYLAGFAIEKYDGSEAGETAVLGNELSTVPISFGTKNMFDGRWKQGFWAYANGVFTSDAYWICTDRIPCKPNTDYVSSWGNGYQTRWQGFVWYDQNYNFISTTNVQQDATNGITAKSPANAAYFGYNIAGPAASAAIVPSDIKNFQIEEGTAATAYEDSAVYSGTLDVLTGVVTVTHKLFAFGVDDVDNWSQSGTGTHYFTRRRPSEFTMTTEASWAAKYYSNFLGNPQRSTSATNVRNNGFYAGSSYLITRADSIADINAFKAYITTTPLQIAVPIWGGKPTIQLTPQEVSSLLGENNMWSNANGNLTVTYAADPATTPIVGKGKVGQAIIGG